MIHNNNLDPALISAAGWSVGKFVYYNDKLEENEKKMFAIGFPIYKRLKDSWNIKNQNTGDIYLYHLPDYDGIKGDAVGYWRLGRKSQGVNDSSQLDVMAQIESDAAAPLLLEEEIDRRQYTDQKNKVIRNQWHIVDSLTLEKVSVLDLRQNISVPTVQVYNLEIKQSKDRFRSLTAWIQTKCAEFYGQNSAEFFDFANDEMRMKAELEIPSIRGLNPSMMATGREVLKCVQSNIG